MKDGNKEKNSAEKERLTDEQRAQHIGLILEKVREGLQTTPFGSIRIELRGPDRNVDVVIESRTRVPIPE